MSAMAAGSVNTTWKYGTGSRSASRSASHSLAAAPWHLGQCRLRHPQPRLRGGGAGVDEGGDNEARADIERGEDLAQRCPEGTLRVPWLLARPSSLLEE